MLLDPVDAFSQRFVSRIRAGDDLKRENALFFQKLVAFCKECFEILMSHRFEHLDGNDLVVRTRQGSIVR